MPVRNSYYSGVWLRLLLGQMEQAIADFASEMRTDLATSISVGMGQKVREGAELIIHMWAWYVGGHMIGFINSYCF